MKKMGNQLSSVKPDFRDICKNVSNVTFLSTFFHFGNTVIFHNVILTYNRIIVDSLK